MSVWCMTGDTFSPEDMRLGELEFVATKMSKPVWMALHKRPRYSGALAGSLARAKLCLAVTDVTDLSVGTDEEDPAEDEVTEYSEASHVADGLTTDHLHVANREDIDTSQRVLARAASGEVMGWALPCVLDDYYFSIPPPTPVGGAGTGYDPRPGSRPGAEALVASILQPRRSSDGGASGRRLSRDRSVPIVELGTVANPRCLSGATIMGPARAFVGSAFIRAVVATAPLGGADLDIRLLCKACELDNFGAAARSIGCREYDGEITPVPRDMTVAAFCLADWLQQQRASSSHETYEERHAIALIPLPCAVQAAGIRGELRLRLVSPRNVLPANSAGIRRLFQCRVNIDSDDPFETAASFHTNFCASGDAWSDVLWCWHSIELTTSLRFTLMEQTPDGKSAELASMTWPIHGALRAVPPQTQHLMAQWLRCGRLQGRTQNGPALARIGCGKRLVRCAGRGRSASMAPAILCGKLSRCPF